MLMIFGSPASRTVSSRMCAGFDRRIQAYRTGATYEILVAFMLATGRRS
jgi:hypothetical protein